MRLFVCVAFLVGLVSCGDFMLESQSDMFGKWAKYKAMETCFGDEVCILYLLKTMYKRLSRLNFELLHIYGNAKIGYLKFGKFELFTDTVSIINFIFKTVDWENLKFVFEHLNETHVKKWCVENAFKLLEEKQ